MGSRCFRQADLHSPVYADERSKAGQGAHLLRRVPLSIRAIKWAVSASQTVDITPVQRCVLFILAYHHNDKSGQCNPAMITIGNECGVSDRSAREAVRALEHVGLIRSRKCSGPAGQATNQYTLFGAKKNKSGRNLRSGTGRNHTTATPGRNPGSDERVYNTTGENLASGFVVFDGGRKHA